MSKKYQIHLKSQSGPIHVLLVNKDTSADSPVVTPVPPPAIETNGNSLQIKQDAMETDVSNSSENSSGAGTSNNVKTEVLETSQGKLKIIRKKGSCFILLHTMTIKVPLASLKKL